MTETDMELTSSIVKEIMLRQKRKIKAENTCNMCDLFEMEKLSEKIHDMDSRLTDYAIDTLSGGSRDISWIAEMMDDTPPSIEEQPKGIREDGGCYVDVIEREDGFFEGEQTGWVYAPAQGSNGQTVYVMFHVNIHPDREY